MTDSIFRRPVCRLLLCYSVSGIFRRLYIKNRMFGKKASVILR
ncbi:hypothetical protein NEISICOT_03119 [Neisseria sicca ATCC 29256]|uniref:Uncharacterized protein n=1 Tax=Neisseria sicca ATCC 29256 TaxID=547045 RepID=C6M994_NEISI|nr:hypothetical protein NEISICOT_03119 [Neisseria sicca ATCC 29256]KJJ11322.1 hypothetical protein HMPREF3156_02649 [Neisseria sp. HMSC06F02]